jgi:2-polyprenyl-3-methyl-5-hydroxy-6-metoxy-1,4-benzoquinol methylase
MREKHKVSVEEIMAEIRLKVKSPYREIRSQGSLERERSSSSTFLALKRFSKLLHSLGLSFIVVWFRRNIFLYDKHHIYRIEDFLIYYDQEFLENAYKYLLQRKIDTHGMKNYLSRLRNGSLSKTDILLMLYYSKEGRSKNVILKGSKKRFLLFKLYHLPLFGYLFKLIATLLSLPRMVETINRNDAYIGNALVQQRRDINHLFKELHQKIDKKYFKLEAQLKELHQKIDKKYFKLEAQLNEIDKRHIKVKEELKRVIQIDRNETNHSLEDIRLLLKKESNKTNQLFATKVNKEEMELQVNSINYAKESIKIVNKSLENLMIEMQKDLSKESLSTEKISLLSKEKESHLDALYVSFEDRFRGTRGEIKNRVEYYLSYVDRISDSFSKVQVLDLGCGRGEWLELLEERGYQAKGIDLNRIMVKISQDFGLDVKEYDAIKYLESLEDSSLEMITGFHIIEHIPFPQLIKMYDEALRVLKPGGLVIFETPNPENLIVGSCNFYTDPTHINPIPPHTAHFILEERGFVNVVIDRIEKGSVYSLSDPLLNEFYNSRIAQYPDYAIIGQKL